MNISVVSAYTYIEKSYKFWRCLRFTSDTIVPANENLARLIRDSLVNNSGNVFVEISDMWRANISLQRKYLTKLYTYQYLA